MYVYGSYWVGNLNTKIPVILGLSVTDLNLNIKGNKRRLAVTSKETIPDVEKGFDPSG